MRRPTLLALSLGAVLLLAGCASKGEPAPENGPETTAATNESASAPVNATAGTNATANQTAPAKDPSMPDDPSSCMRGMDMPGCTAAQAEAYAKAQEANAGPRPDQALTPVKIALNLQGTDQKATVALDEGTMTLFATVYVNDTGQGPYLALGPGGQGDVTLQMKGANTTKTFTLAGSGSSVGVDPAAPLAKKYTAALEMPESGAWTITVGGQGQAVQVEVDLLERFVM